MMSLSINAKREVMTRLHHIMEDVGNKEIPVDVGHALTVKLLFGLNTYLSIPFLDKLVYMRWLANFTHEAVCSELSDFEIEMIYDTILESHFSDN